MFRSTDMERKSLVHLNFTIGTGFVWFNFYFLSLVRVVSCIAAPTLFIHKMIFGASATRPLKSAAYFIQTALSTAHNRFVKLPA